MLFFLSAGLSFLFLSLAPDILRFSFGPLPSWICCIHLVIKTAHVWIFLLYIDAIIIARYLFIFCLKNPAAFADDFWCCFVSIWIYAISLVTLSSWNFLVNFETMGINICSGANPEIKRYYAGFPKEVFGFLVITSILLNVCIHLKICIHKAKPLFSNCSPTSLIKTFIMGIEEKQSLFTFAFNVFGIIIIFTIILALAQLQKIRIQDMAIYPNFLLLYYINLVGPALFVAAVAISFFFKKPVLNAVSQETKILCSG